MARLKFFYKFHRWPNYEQPHDLNEKMNWLKFYGDTSQWADLADKYTVREYVKSKGFEETLVKLYGKWDNVEDIDFDKLPYQFVMKCNNGRGDALICKDKNSIDINAWKSYFKKMLSKKYGIVTGEPHYFSIKPCIIAEELLDISKQLVKSSSLIDYKVWCFNGKPSFIWACYNRTKESTEVALYDTDWNHPPEYSVYTHHYKEAKLQIPKPACLKRMLEVAAKLSEGFPILRCDLYEVGGKFENIHLMLQILFVYAVMYFLIIPLVNKYFYIMIGKSKGASWKDSIKLI